MANFVRGIFFGMLVAQTCCQIGRRIDPCKRQPFFGRRSVTTPDGRIYNCQVVMRYALQDDRCLGYPYSYCHEDTMLLFRYKDECEKFCKETATQIPINSISDNRLAVQSESKTHRVSQITTLDRTLPHIEPLTSSDKLDPNAQPLDAAGRLSVLDLDQARNREAQIVPSRSHSVVQPHVDIGADLDSEGQSTSTDHASSTTSFSWLPQTTASTVDPSGSTTEDRMLFWLGDPIHTEDLIFPDSRREVIPVKSNTIQPPVDEVLPIKQEERLAINRETVEKPERKAAGPDVSFAIESKPEVIEKEPETSDLSSLNNDQIRSNISHGRVDVEVAPIPTNPRDGQRNVDVTPIVDEQVEAARQDDDPHTSEFAPVLDEVDSIWQPLIAQDDDGEGAPIVDEDDEARRNEDQTAGEVSPIPDVDERQKPHSPQGDQQNVDTGPKVDEEAERKRLSHIPQSADQAEGEVAPVSDNEEWHEPPIPQSGDRTSEPAQELAKEVELIRQPHSPEDDDKTANEVSPIADEKVERRSEPHIGLDDDQTNGEVAPILDSEIDGSSQPKIPQDEEVTLTGDDVAGEAQPLIPLDEQTNDNNGANTLITLHEQPNETEQAETILASLPSFQSEAQIQEDAAELHPSGKPIEDAANESEQLESIVQPLLPHAVTEPDNPVENLPIEQPENELVDLATNPHELAQNEDVLPSPIKPNETSEQVLSSLPSDPTDSLVHLPKIESIAQTSHTIVRSKPVDDASNFEIIDVVAPEEANHEHALYKEGELDDLFDDHYFNSDASTVAETKQLNEENINPPNDGSVYDNPRSSAPADDDSAASNGDLTISEVDNVQRPGHGPLTETPDNKTDDSGNPAVDHDGEPTVDKPVDPSVRNPDDDPLVNNPDDDPTVNNRDDDPSVNNPIDDPSVNKSDDDPTVNNRDDDLSVNNPDDDPAVNNPDDDPLDSSPPQLPLNSNLPELPSVSSLPQS